jgi:hypothetical protein
VDKKLTTTTKTMEVKYFKVKHKVLKNSLHFQIWSDFENFLLNCQTKVELFHNKKILLGKYPSYPGKTKATKYNFLINFVRVLVCLRLAFEKNLPTEQWVLLKLAPCSP